jgi:DNA polymerase-3 subunit alpha
MSRTFAHLHLHTQYSLLQGAIRMAVPDDVRKAGVAFKILPEVMQERGLEACAITDSGNLFGAAEFFKTLKKAKLKPLVGMEAYVIEGGRKDAVEGRGQVEPAQLVLLCQNAEGYRNLVKLSSLGFMEGKVGDTPCLDRELLERHRAGLICLTGGLEGVVTRPLSRGDAAKARGWAQWLGQVFDGRCYIEVQNHGLEAQRLVNPQLVGLAKDLGLPLVGTNDCHYLEREEAYAHYVLELMGAQKKVTDPGVEAFVDRQLYLKSPDEMAEALRELPEEAYANTGAIAEQCDLDLSVSKVYLPQYAVPSEFTEEAWFRKLAQDGLERRIAQLAPTYGQPHGQPADPRHEAWQPYRARLEFELDVITKMKYAGYFLIVADFINWAKDNHVRVGPGRGSGAGSLVAYALRITDLDPIRNKLVFERFLNPERVSLPDFDVDFEVRGREQVIDYVRRKYGDDKVAQISTFGALKAKAALRGVARVLDFPYGQADRIAKLIPNKLNITLQEAITLEPELARMEREGQENERKLIELGKRLELLSSNLSTHAAGVIIMDQPIMDVMPVCTPVKGEGLLQTQFSMKWAEDQGAVKFDFLGLLNLDIISHAQALINERREPGTPAFDVDLVPLDDPATYKLLARGDTTGVFQLESGGMRRLTMDLKASTFEDIVAVVALYRPGPMQLIPSFVQRKHGREHVDYLHPKLEGVLKETYGIMVYQEQVIQAAQILAGYSLGEADLLRRAIGKKIPQEMAAQRQRFIDGCAQNGILQAKAQEIFEKIDYFSGYGFNKSHSAAYGLISYQTAYLKARYPVEYMTALLSSDMDNTDKVVNFIADCRAMKVQVLPPDVNHSGVGFTIAGRAVRFGLNALKNVGGSAAQVILDARAKQPEGRFADLTAFIRSVDMHRVNKRVVEALVKSGAFDSLHANRGQLLAGLDYLVSLGIQEQSTQVEGQDSLFSLLDGAESHKVGLQITLPTVPDLPARDRLKLEKEALGFYISGHPMDRFQSELGSLAISSNDIREGDFADDSRVLIAGVIASIAVRMNKNAEKFAVLRLEDLRGSIEVAVYSKVYAASQDLLKLDEPLLIAGRTRVWEEQVSVAADSVTSLSRFRAEQAQRLTLHLKPSLAEDAYPRLMGMLAKTPGRCGVRFTVGTAQGHQVLLDAGLSIAPQEGLMDELHDLMQGGEMQFEYAKDSLPTASAGRGAQGGYGSQNGYGGQGGNGSPGGHGGPADAPAG